MLGGDVMLKNVQRGGGERGGGVLLCWGGGGRRLNMKSHHS